MKRRDVLTMGAASAALTVSPAPGEAQTTVEAAAEAYQQARDASDQFYDDILGELPGGTPRAKHAGRIHDRLAEVHLKHAKEVAEAPAGTIHDVYLKLAVERRQCGCAYEPTWEDLDPILSEMAGLLGEAWPWPSNTQERPER